MKNKYFSITLAMVLVLISAPAWSYTAEVGFVKWFNHKNLPDETFFTDNFNGTAGALTIPPYRWLEGNPTKDGNGNLLMTNTSYPNNGRTAVGLPTEVSSPISTTRFMVNLRSGLPAAGYIFWLDIHPSDTDYMSFGLYNAPGLGRGMFFLDETHPINDSTFNPIKVTYTIESFTSIALMLKSDEYGVFTPYYWLDMPDDFNIKGSDGNWVQFGTSETSSIGADHRNAYAGFGVGTVVPPYGAAPVPLPGSLLLFAPGLAGLGMLRRRFAK